MRLREAYGKKTVPKIRKTFKLSNDLAVPRILKVVLNTGFKDPKDKELIKQIEADFWSLSGQKPVFRKSRKSIANFKIRQGQEIGLMTTLRRKKMWDFIERLVGATLPRVRDFRGLPESSFDSQGNLTIGLLEHIVFPEIDPEKSPRNFSLEATIVMSSRNRELNMAVLKEIGFPVKDSKDGS